MKWYRALACWRGAMRYPATQQGEDRTLKNNIGQKIERWLEAFIFASRWILAPIYAGLALALVILFVKFAEEFVHLAARTFSGSEADIVLGVLTLVDLALTGSLIVIVVFSGYENFVSRVDHSGHKDWPEWMGTIDFTGLKLKLLSSIVAISGVQLLKQFMDISKVSDRDLFWYIVIHMVFVGSSVLLALSDRIAASSHAKHAPTPPPAAPPAS